MRLLNHLENLIENYVTTKGRLPNYISANKNTINKIETEFKELLDYASVEINNKEIFHYRGIPCIPNEEEPFIQLFPL